MIKILEVKDEYLAPLISAYPPQANSYNIEYKFYKKALKQKNVDSFLVNIPIQWENIFSNKLANVLEVEKDLNDKLDKNTLYFTVCKYEGGPQVDLDNILIFTPSGIFDMLKQNNQSYLPLPLITDKYTQKPKVHKRFLASYIGRNTHPIRIFLQQKYRYDRKFFVKNLDSMSSVFSEIDQSKYKKVISESYFSLCPRGFGPTSFRLYESFELGSVPVYISDEYFLPFKEFINWKDLCIFSSFQDLHKLKKNLNKTLNSSRYQYMLEYGKFCSENYFTNEFVEEYILNTVSKFN